MSRNDTAIVAALFYMKHINNLLHMCHGLNYKYRLSAVLPAINEK